MKFEETVVSRLSKNPYVVGYDPFNEPVGVFKNFLSIIDAFIPGKWDRFLLEPFYSRVFKMLKKVDQHSIMFFEATLPDWVTVNIGEWQVISDVKPLGYSEPPGAKETDRISHVSHDHSYCCTMNQEVCKDNDEPGS